MLQVFFAYLRPAPISVNSSPFSPGFLSHPDITSQQPPHNLESNFTLNVVPVRLPSRDKVPVCPCLIHEEHLLRVSDETWQWHKMKVDTWARLLAKSWKMWEGVALQIKAPWRLGGHQIWDMLKIQHVDILFRGCRHIWYQGRAEQAVTGENMMMIWCDETYLIDIQHISPRSRCQGVLVWCWNSYKFWASRSVRQCVYNFSYRPHLSEPWPLYRAGRC